MKRLYFAAVLLICVSLISVNVFAQATTDPKKLTPLFGTWKFYYKTTSFHVSTINLNRLVNDSGEYFAYGINDKNNAVVASFHVGRNLYGVVVDASDVDELFTFEKFYGPFVFGTYSPQTKFSGEPLGSYDFFGIRVKKTTPTQ